MTSGGGRISLLRASCIWGPLLKVGIIVPFELTRVQLRPRLWDNPIALRLLRGEPHSGWWCTDDKAKAKVCHHSLQKTINENCYILCFQALN